MWNRKAAVPGLTAAAVLFAGACSDTPPTEPSIDQPEVTQLFGAPIAPAAAAEQTLDAQLAQLARQVPGFGGMYYADGALNVVMTGEAQTMSTAALRQSLGSELAAMGVDLAAQPVRVQAGQYDFAQLHTMHQAIAAVHGISGVIFTDADEVANRVRIGVEHAAARASVEHALGMLNVPREAFIVSDAQPIIPMQSLQQRVRPLAGGLQINFPGFVCTLGFNVRSPNRPNVHGFVTNSHCTNSQWNFNPNAPTPYGQPSPTTPGPNFIGWEAHDAPGFTTPPCPAGRRCRYSDAAGVIYTANPDSVAFGRIYRTMALGTGTLQIDATNPRWEIVAERQTQIVGDVLHKTGRTTGWTSGTVANTCVTTNLGGSDITLLCDNYVQAGARIVQGGDSGSGVWRRLGTGADMRVELNGILWGGTGDGLLWAHSSMQGIRTDNPPPAGVQNWITYPGQTPPGM